MNDQGKSDSKIVPEKSLNKARELAAEEMEGSTLAEGNELQLNRLQTQGRESLQSKLQLIRENAKADKEKKFTALLHHIYNIENLRTAYFTLKKDAAPGVDKETWESYGEGLQDKLQDLSERLKRGAYRAKPVRRVYIAKPDGSKRPLGITAIEDKIVQRATVEILNAIYEVDFKGFSYGFRPGRNQHQALDALSIAILTKKVNWILDADIRDYFGSIRFEDLIKFVEKRITDKRVLHLIQKWLNAGVLEDGKIEYADKGSPQGSNISPVLANIYLHYVYDQWIQEWRKQRARGEVIVVRFADDTIVGFQYQDDAAKFLPELREQFKQYGLELHPEKTRMIEFGRFAAANRSKRGEGKPETFTFLGFRHICGKSRDGKFQLQRHTLGKKMRAKLESLKKELRERINEPIFAVGTWLSKVLHGHYQYYGVPGNYAALNDFRHQTIVLWKRTLNRRSQRKGITWQRMIEIAARWLPTPKITHPYPSERFYRLHPRQEPCAVVPHARI